MSVMEDIVEYDQIGVLATQHERTGYSPIEHVPAEILCDIFLSWMLEYSWHGEHRIILPHSPYLLARVCSQWCKIIYDTPRLWASPHVRVPSGMDITDGWMETLVTYLARSKACPLSVTLEAERVQAGLEKLVKALIPHVGRVYSLHVSLPSYVCKELQHLDIGEQGWSNLENLSIVTWGPTLSRSMSHGHSLTFSKAPKLREVTLEADDRRGDHLLRTLSLALPWAQIKKLVTSGVFHIASDARDIILKCPLLEHCSLGRIFVPPRGEVIPYVPICTFSHLRSLSVVFRTDFLGNEASFFQPLVMPTLQQLDIRATALPVSSETPAYISFIYSHCGSTLTQLSINCIPFDDTNAVVVLELLPALVSFRASLTYTTTREDFFGALTYDPTSLATPLVPRLERLDIDEYPFFNGPRMPPTTLAVKAIASRWWSDAYLATTLRAVARLKYVRLSCGRDGSLLNSGNEDAATIGRCQDEGLDVWISGMPYEVSSDIASVDIDNEAITAWVSGVSVVSG